MYRCIASTAAGFVQQLAVGYIGRGYYFYVTGTVPEGKDPEAVDQKLITKYGITESKATRARRKLAGFANVQLLRFNRFFVLLATHGEHKFFGEEQALIRDAREVPLKFGPYSVSYRRGHVQVRIAREEFRNLKALFVSAALRKSQEILESELHALPYEPYAPVRRQLFRLLGMINRVRKAASLAPLSHRCLRMRRRSVRPFDLPLDTSRAHREYDRTQHEFGTSEVHNFIPSEVRTFPRAKSLEEGQ